jgi:hypothetical protein
MQAYSGAISLTALAVSVISGLYNNSQIQALKLIVDSHSLQLKELQSTSDDLKRLASQSLEISSNSATKIEILGEDLRDLTYTTAGEGYVPPSEEPPRSRYHQKPSSNRTPRSPAGRNRIQSRQTSTNELSAMAAEIGPGTNH